MEPLELMRSSLFSKIQRRIPARKDMHDKNEHGIISDHA
jgi:hypothetical protein